MSQINFRKDISNKSSSAKIILMAALLVANFLVTSFSQILDNNNGDDSTQTPTWQISRGLAYANHQYTDVPVYNCNGSCAIITDNKEHFYISANLTANPVKLEFKSKPKGKIEWDRKDPDIIYYISKKDNKTLLHNYNIKSGTDEVIYTTEEMVSEIAPPHPDGDHLLLFSNKKSKSVIQIFSIKTKKCIKIPIDIPLHRVRFTTAPDLSVYVNSPKEPKPSYIINVKTEEKKLIYKGQQTSPNWRPGGKEYCFYGFDNGKRRLMVLNTNGKIIKTFAEPTNHHVCWSPDGKYIVTDPEMHRKGKYQGWICLVDYNTGEVKKIVKHESEFRSESEKLSSGHPHPRLSPDGTKVIYNSNKLGIKYPQVFVSLVHLPNSVTSVHLNKSEDYVNLTWKNPEGVEIHCCLVYRIMFDGKSELAEVVDIPNASFFEKLKPNVKGYKIVSEEYSGFKSKAITLLLNRK